MKYGLTTVFFNIFESNVQLSVHLLSYSLISSEIFLLLLEFAFVERSESSFRDRYLSRPISVAHLPLDSAHQSASPKKAYLGRAQKSLPDFEQFLSSLRLGSIEKCAKVILKKTFGKKPPKMMINQCLSIEGLLAFQRHQRALQQAAAMSGFPGIPGPPGAPAPGPSRAPAASS